VEVILVIDTLNLKHDQISLAKSEAEIFLRRNNGHLAQPVSLYLISNANASSSPRLSSMQGPSTDGNALADAIARGRELPVVRENRVFQGGEGNEPSFKTYVMGRPSRDPSLPFLGSIVLEARRRPGRKLLFWLSPGWPVNFIGADVIFNYVTELSTRLREARISLWNWPYPEHVFDYVGFLAAVRSAEKVQAGHLALDVLAVQSGGGRLDTSTELAKMIERCVEQESVFYTLTFDPPLTNQEDDYRDLKVAVTLPDLSVRTTSGYYNQPVYNDHPSEAKRVTVEELERILATSGKKDVAEALSGVVLTERMSSAKLLSWEARLRGERAWAALVALADRSVFLAPPTVDIPAVPPPDLSARKAILSKTIEYLSKTILKLPNFFAIRTTVQYDEPAQRDEQKWKSATGDQSLHVTQTSRTTVTFRNGKEVVDAEARKGKKLSARERQLDTQGTFGPILAMVFAGAAAARSGFTWSRWEQSREGQLAVFRYEIPRDSSRFEVGFCCLADPDGTIFFREKAAYRGEVAIDPASGAVLRLTVDAEMEPRLPMTSSGIMVEYGAVTIGAKTYICPTRSVSISRQRTVKLVREWGDGFGVYGRFETILNDVAFEKYHVFRAESQILPGYTTVPQER
jgi:VWFA-related protein